MFLNFIFNPDKMDKLFNSILKISLFIFLISGLVGFYLLSVEQEVYALTCAKIGGFGSTIFTAIVIGEVLASKNARFSTKAVWITSFLIFQIFAGVAYYFADRKAIYQP
jgi:O-antigen/teichoic acid export membrane protein